MRALKTVLLAIALIAGTYFAFAFIFQDLWWCVGEAATAYRMMFVLVLIMPLGSIILFGI